MAETTLMKKTILRSRELSCPSCISKIERALTQKNGVGSATVLFSTGKIVVEHDPSVVTPDDLVSIVRKVGYEAKVAAF